MKEDASFYEDERTKAAHSYWTNLSLRQIYSILKWNPSLSRYITHTPWHSDCDTSTSAENSPSRATCAMGHSRWDQDATWYCGSQVNKVLCVGGGGGLQCQRKQSSGLTLSRLNPVSGENSPGVTKPTACKDNTSSGWRPQSLSPGEPAPINQSLPGGGLARHMHL